MSPKVFYMSSQRRCELREGETFYLRDKAGECGVDVKALRDALLHLRSSIRSPRLSFGPIDTPRPDVKGDKGFAGFWVGVYDRDDVELVITPRLKNYSAMVEAVEEVLPHFASLYLSTLGLLTASSALAIYTSAAKVLYEAYLAASRSPRLLTVLEPGSDGTLKMRKGAVLSFRRSYRPNKPLVNAVVLSVRRVLLALDETRKIVEGLPASVKKIVSSYMGLIKKAASSVIAELGDVYQWADGEEFGEFWHIAAATVRGHIGVEGEEARFVLLPSTKLYELYVFASFLKALGGVRSQCGTLCIETEQATLYFNQAPSSRIIEKLSRRKPRPDISISEKKVIVVDAKYRHLHRLPLPDSLRLTAYLVDVASDGRLTAVVTALRKPVRDRVEAKINGVALEVLFAEVNPDGDVEIPRVLRQLNLPVRKP